MKRLIAIILFLIIATSSFAIITAYPSAHAQIELADVYTFGFTFIMGFIGGYLLWGILASLAAVAGVYILTKDKHRRRLAWYGCIIGCTLGIILKIIALS